MNESPPPIFDTHAHLDDASFDADRPTVVERARAAGVRRILNIAYRPDIWDASVNLRARFPEIELAAGIHPQDADAFRPEQAAALGERLLALRPRGVGEAGFDFARSGPSFAQQEAAFRWQIELAIDVDLPLIIHQRDAIPQLMSELDRWPQLKRVVLHSFDGDQRLAAWARERRFFVGVGGLACRRSSATLRDALRVIPEDRLLLETDAPYLAPPGAASRRNEPANLPLVANVLSSLWDLSPEQLCQLATDNARIAFHLE